MRLEEDNFIATGIYDELIADGIEHDPAVEIVSQVADAMARDKNVARLVFAMVLDHTGRAHGCVMREPPGATVPIYAWDIASRRRAGREHFMELLRIDIAAPDDSMAI